MNIYTSSCRLKAAGMGFIHEGIHLLHDRIGGITQLVMLTSKWPDYEQELLGRLHSNV